MAISKLHKKAPVGKYRWHYRQTFTLSSLTVILCE